jgi:regulator of protease activity HflC (stomatin/prohibitin superfamily)
MGLEPLFSWIPALLLWLLSWCPWGARLPVHEGGVKISGKKVRVISPGWYFWIPRFTQVFTDNVKRKVIELPEQLLTTKDGKRVRAGGILVYHIQNIETWLVENESPEDGVQVEAARALRDWIKARTFDDVQAYRPGKRKDDELTTAAQGELGSDFGVWVRQLALASFAETSAMDINHSGGEGPMATVVDDDE